MLTNKEAIRILKYERPSEEYVGRLKEAIDMAIETLSTETIQLKQADTLIIATALQYLIEDEERHELDRASAKKLREQILKFGASMCANEAAQAVQDCKNCKHGKYNDHWDTWFCYNSCDCSNWDLWESAEVIQRGEWIEIENGIYVCPFCKNQIEALIPPDYCPYCRAALT